MAVAKKLMRAEVESGVIISTVMFTDTGVYQTMAFNTADDMDEIDCAETDVYANALEHHMMMVHKFLQKQQKNSLQVLLWVEYMKLLPSVTVIVFFPIVWKR